VCVYVTARKDLGDGACLHVLTQAQGGDARRALNETLTRQQLTNLMMLDSSEQVLLSGGTRM
jgi:hypothetical protein